MTRTSKNIVKKSFAMHPEVFTKLKEYSERHKIPYGLIIEGLADFLTSNPDVFSKVDFHKFKYK